jgi:uncharacterized membrane protein
MTINQQTQSQFESVVAPARDRGDAGHINVASSERWLSLLLGSSLLLLGAARPKTRVPWVLASGVLLFRGATGRCPLYDLLGINTTNAYPHPATSVPHQRGIRVEDSIQINKPADELYRFWRSFENLPRFMTQHVAVERCDGDTRSHWRVKSVGGTTFEWDAEIINDIPK